jgi:N-acetylglutamate synthase-like GNAT family acetyltransferase
MKLRTAKAKDVDVMVDIISQTFSKADARTAREEIEEIMALKSSKQFWVLAEEGKEVIGLAGVAQSWLDFNIYEIFWVAVRPDCQKGGIGAKIIGDVLRRVKAFKGQGRANAVLVSTDAPSFFSKCGFKTLDKYPKTTVSLMVVKFD